MKNNRWILCVDNLGKWITNFLTKYWIFVSCGMLLLVSIQGTVVVYRIIYMAFYLFFILSFQVINNFSNHILSVIFQLSILSDLLWILATNSSYIPSCNYYLLNARSYCHIHSSSNVELIFIEEKYSLLINFSLKKLANS